MFAYLRWVNRWCFKRFLVTLKLSLCCQGQLIFAMDILRFITKEGACSLRWCYIFCNILFSGFRASSWSCCCHGNKVLSLFDSEWDRCLPSYVSPIFRMDVRWRFFSRSIWWQCSPFSWLVLWEGTGNGDVSTRWRKRGGRCVVNFTHSLLCIEWSICCLLLCICWHKKFLNVPGILLFSGHYCKSTEAFL